MLRRERSCKDKRSPAWESSACSQPTAEERSAKDFGLALRLWGKLHSFDWHGDVTMCKH